MFGSSLFLFGLHSVHVCYMSCIYLPSPFPYQKIFVSFNSNTTGAASGTGTAYPRRAPPSPTSVFSGVRDVQSESTVQVTRCNQIGVETNRTSFPPWSQPCKLHGVTK
jgi:hypothetical protein